MIGPHDDVEELLQRALTALYFWLPHVPATGPEEIIDRIAKDAELLVHLEGAETIELDAEARGWIKLRSSPDSNAGQSK